MCAKIDIFMHSFAVRAYILCNSPAFVDLRQSACLHVSVILFPDDTSLYHHFSCWFLWGVNLLADFYLLLLGQTIGQRLG